MFSIEESNWLSVPFFGVKTMTKDSRRFIEGFVMARVSENLTVDRDRAVKDISEELSFALPSKDSAEIAVKAALKQLQDQGFIEINDAKNIVQDDPIGALKELSKSD